jgi:acyl carrier protein
MNNFYAKLTDILETDEVKPESILREFEIWDSLTILTILAMADASYGVSMTAEDLKPIYTAGQLADYIAAKKTK